MMADDVLAVLDHAGVQRASLVGTSLGGMIAQELALAHPGGSTSWSWWPRSQADLRAAPCRYPPPTCSLGRRS
jgi:pimeloyl-ACP methyl ester carboxylesterase